MVFNERYTMINEPVQKILLALGQFGCLFLCILRAAELMMSKALNEVFTYVECAKKISIINGTRKQWVDSECFVNCPHFIFGYLVGGDWSYSWENIDYKPVPGEIVFLRYEWKKNTSETSSHFCLGDIDKNCVYDPMGDSLTRLNGKLAGIRILRRSK